MPDGRKLRIRPYSSYYGKERYDIKPEDFRVTSNYGQGVTCLVPAWYYRQIALMLERGDEKFARMALERDSGLWFSSLHLYRVANEREDKQAQAATSRK